MSLAIRLGVKCGGCDRLVPINEVTESVKCQECGTVTKLGH